MKTKSAGKSVVWVVRFLGTEEPMSACYTDRSEIEKLKRFWERKNPTVRYELVKITTEPVAVETKKRKATK